MWCYLSIGASSSVNLQLASSSIQSMAPTTNKKKPKSKQSLESQFNYSLNSHSKSKDVRSAISLYDSAISETSIRLSQHHFNTLLYLCSISITDPSTKDLSLQHGFRIFDHMVSCGVKPNEASITSVARLAAAKGDSDYAFDLVRNMKLYNVLPRLRTYDPALFCYCEKLEADKAYEVEEHMGSMGVSLEEPELAALLRVSAETGKEQKVYEYLHKLRKTVRCVKEETAKVVKAWFEGFMGNGVELDTSVVRESISKNGGGWHGLGWIGKGRWAVTRGNVEMSGRCCSCREQLVRVDIDDAETNRLADSLAGLAKEREVKANFAEFQEWLDRYPNYEAIVDGANVGLYQQNFAEGGFSISQLDAVVRELYNQNGKKWPLIVLHSKRVRSLLEDPSCRELIEEWMKNDVLYTSPHGSNDDWYWLYAAVKLRCLLVTNDEMRDHIFELLGPSFFLKWKERHQVRYTFVKGTLKLLMPPLFSMVIQESEKGSWHLPVASDCNEESAQSWVCITRASVGDALEDHVNKETCDEGESIFGYTEVNGKCTPECIISNNKHDSSQRSDNKTIGMNGKRKERSPSHS